MLSSSQVAYSFAFLVDLTVFFQYPTIVVLSLVSSASAFSLYCSSCSLKLHRASFLAFINLAVWFLF